MSVRVNSRSFLLGFSSPKNKYKIIARAVQLVNYCIREAFPSSAVSAFARQPAARRLRTAARRFRRFTAIVLRTTSSALELPGIVMAFATVASTRRVSIVTSILFRFTRSSFAASYRVSTVCRCSAQGAQVGCNCHLYSAPRNSRRDGQRKLLAPKLCRPSRIS